MLGRGANPPTSGAGAGRVDACATFSSTNAVAWSLVLVVNSALTHFYSRKSSRIVETTALTNSNSLLPFTNPSPLLRGRPKNYAPAGTKRAANSRSGPPWTYFSDILSRRALREAKAANIVGHASGVTYVKR